VSLRACPHSLVTSLEAFGIEQRNGGSCVSGLRDATLLSREGKEGNPALQGALGQTFTLVTVAVVVTSRLRWVEPDQGVNPHDSDTCFHRALELLYLAHTGFQNTQLDNIHYLALG